MISVRAAERTDVDAIVAAVTGAFFDDPLWGLAFPDVDRRYAQASAMWRVLVESALRLPWMLVTDKVESVALWIPPGAHELTDEEESGFEDFLSGLVGAGDTDRIMAIFEQLEAVHPSEPHFYLSILATHDDHRGRGLGMALLRENLSRIDALGAPAYLESCNPVNNDRYHGVGFVDRDEIVTAAGQVVTTMWRPTGG
ncbi:MAG TPA: GNAT family N-acetyltransferase [Micromonosporaceae bacterium]|jgi:GNAT superfamily N-acetyltransferase